MKIIDADFFTYRLPLKRPLILKNTTVTERRGCLIKLTSDSGAIGWGDVAPLPGFSVESLERPEAILMRLRKWIIGQTVASDETDSLDRFLFGVFFVAREPSVHCGLEMAVHNLLAAEVGRPMADMLGDNPADEILLNGLITDDDDAVECSSRFKRDGFSAVKLKVGLRGMAEDVDRIILVRRELGDKIALRLDANRAWEFDQAVRFAEQVAQSGVEYIEEPLSDPTHLSEFVSRTGMAVALDESLLGFAPHDLHKHNYAEAVILKPTLLGGLMRTARWAQIARELGMKVVVSSCFESGVGIAALAQFAAAYSQPGVAAGLDTLDRFERDVIKESIRTVGGRINISQAWTAARSVDEIAINPRACGNLLSALDDGRRYQNDLPLLSDGDLVVTRHQASGIIELLARKLRASGLGHGDRIAIVENNRIELPLLLLACLRAEIVAVLVSPRYPEAGRKAMISSTGCRTVAIWESSSVNPATYSGIDEFVVPSMASLFDAQISLHGWDGELTSPKLNNPWTIMFTSGSTGTPKAVLHSAGDHQYSALGSNAVLPVGPGDRWLMSLPPHHVGGLGILCRCLLGGATIVFERRSVDLAERIVQDQITHLSLVPTQLRRLLKHPDLSILRSSLKAILLGGAPIPLDLLQQASDAGLPVYPTYGLTEMTSQVATGSPGKPDKLRILPFREVMIAHDGTIYVRGKTLFLGYVTAQGIERPHDADGWFHTGDIGHIDSRGYLYVLGRKDNMFISGGENIHPEQIEAALAAIEGVEDSVVVPVDDTDYGQRPVAFLRYRPDFNLSETESDLSEEARLGFDHQSLSAKLEKTLPRYMLPMVYYPWPHGYTPAGIKHDRPFFKDLAARLHRNKR